MSLYLVEKHGEKVPGGLVTLPKKYIFQPSRISPSVLLCLIGWLMGVSALAQSSGANPAIGVRSIAPTPLEKVGSVFSMTFAIGNAGAAAPITSAREADRMGFFIDLQGCGPNGDPEKALTGSLLRWFDVRYNKNLNRIEGQQKPDVSLNPITSGRLIIAAVVTQASSSTADNTIGAACTIVPNASAQPVQSIDDDYGYVYTHTQEVVLSDVPVDYLVQAQPDQTVGLSWAFRPDGPAKGFMIERSKDMKSFETVGDVRESSVGSDKLNHFRFVDSKPYRGTSYYRLSHVDAAGGALPYQPMSVVLGGGYGVTDKLVAGQPFVVTLDEPETALLHLYTDRGKEIEASRSSVNETSIKLSPVDKLVPGVYWLTVQERALMRQHRMVVN